jgi:hypothetical protein
MKHLVRNVSKRFVIGVLILTIVSGVFAYFSLEKFRVQFATDLRKASERTRSAIETQREVVLGRIEDRARVLKNLARGNFGSEIFMIEKIASSEWLWIRSKNYEWKSNRWTSDTLPELGTMDPLNSEIRTHLDLDRQMVLFQVPFTKKLSETEESVFLIEAALPLSNILTSHSPTQNLAVYFVGPDGNIYPLGADSESPDFRPGKNPRKKLANVRPSGADLWNETDLDGFGKSGRVTTWGTLQLAGSNFHLLFGNQTVVRPRLIFLILALMLIVGIWTLFLQESLWFMLPEVLEGRGSKKNLTLPPTRAQAFLSGLQERVQNLSLEPTENSAESLETGQIDRSEATPKLNVVPPPTLLPRLFLKRKADERVRKQFSISLNTDERQSFIRRMGIEISSLETVESLNAFFAGTLSRLLDQCPVTFFEYNETDGKTLLKTRLPENLFSKVIPAAFLPPASSDFLGPSLNNYLKDLSKLSPELVSPNAEWTTFVVGSGTNHCGAWCLPTQLDTDARFFLRMLCEVHFGHYRFLKAEEIERQKTFFQEDAVKSRMLEEMLVGKRLRHPYCMALIETKLWDPQRSTLESMFFGRDRDETLRAKSYIETRIRRSDHVYILNENQLLLFFPHTALLDLLQKTEKIAAEWNSKEPATHGIRAAMIEYPTHGDTVESLWKVVESTGERLKKAPAGQVMMATAQPGYLPPFKSRFIRSAMFPENP